MSWTPALKTSLKPLDTPPYLPHKADHSITTFSIIIRSYYMALSCTGKGGEWGECEMVERGRGNPHKTRHFRPKAPNLCL
jgi:hypothetical protein